MSVTERALRDLLLEARIKATDWSVARARISFFCHWCLRESGPFDTIDHAPDCWVRRVDALLAEPGGDV